MAAGAFMLYALLPSPANIQGAMDAMRAAAVAMGCPAERVRVSTRVDYPKTEIEVLCVESPQ